METLLQQIFDSGGVKLISLPEVSPASPSVQPDYKKAQPIRATFGPTFTEPSSKFTPVSSWAKTFAGLLAGMEGWYSTRCALTWITQGTKSARLYYLLQVSMPRTKEKGYGLLPTPAAQEPQAAPQGSTNHGNYFRRADGSKLNSSINLLAQAGLLPTPKAYEVIEHPMKAAARLGDRTGEKLNNLSSGAAFGLLPTPDVQNHRDGAKLRKDNNMLTGGRHGVSLHHLGAYSLLPTPRASANENRQTSLTPAQLQGKHGLSLAALAGEALLPTPRANDAVKNGAISADPRNGLPGLSANGLLPKPDIIHETGSMGSRLNPRFVAGSRLSPRFVAEMMGFPPDWLQLPFEGNGVTEL